MSSICFIVVYFGKLPSNFNLWLNSCKYNKTIDFILITDDKTDFEFPENVKVIYMSFDKLVCRFQGVFDYKIKLEAPYKLCDYKPAYGEAFQDYIKGYEYWGYCDIDLIWGDIRSFVTEKVLRENQRILTRGHCSIFPNTKESNMMYRTLTSEGCQNAKDVYQSSQNCCYDEWAQHCGYGISEIFKRNNVKQYDEVIFADINFLKYKFYPNNRGVLHKYKNVILEFKEGKLYLVYNCKGEVSYEEVMYAHFQKRFLETRKNSNETFWIIPPNKVVDNINDLSKYKLQKLTFRRGINIFVIKFRVNQIKKKARQILKI
ncbi:DUF6625 family protein [Priestia megaterium]|uniref:DUF6625 family protein n=1 Tax=Priestia megaterium TaxID=1404 RepID=UPI0022B88927|nr:DUF6625 family protein [Priestia megaterium]MCZ8493360.1 hypothetical protein [Priestia megaterium]